MRLGIKAKQVLGVTTIVGLVVVALSAIQLSALARMNLEESAARGGLLSSAIFQRARAVVAEGGDPRAALAADPGIRSLLESSIAYSPNVTYAAIVAADGTVIAHSDPTLQGTHLAREPALETLLEQHALAQLGAIYQGRGRTFEVVQPLLLNNVTFGSIRIGVSTLLIRQDLNTALRPAVLTAAAALLIAMVVAMLLAQVVLRPIHVISSGLSRRRVRRARQLVQRRQRPPVGRSRAAGRRAGNPRVGRRAARGRRGAVRDRRRAAVRQPAAVCAPPA